MCKVVVADDEIKVCQLICNLIDWKAIGMEIVGVANNGIEALELIKRFEPDIVITDIRMPGYDGLELIKYGKEIKENIDFIIISGYSHFEYAKTAIKYGVIDYLLKPIKKDELLEILNKIREKNRQKSEKISNENIGFNLQKDLKKLRSLFFVEKLLNNDKKKKEVTLEQYNQNYYFKFQPGIFQIFIIKLDYENEEQFENSLKIIKDKIVSILNKMLKHECFEMEIYFNNSRGYCLLNYEEANKKIIRKLLKNCLDEIIIQKNIYGGIKFTIGIGMTVKDINELENSMIAAEAAIEQRLIEGTDKIIENIQFQSYCNDNSLIIDFTNNIEKTIEILDLNGAIKVCELFKDKLFKNANLSGYEFFNFIKEAFNIFLIVLKKYQLDSTILEQINESFYNRLELCSSASQLFLHFERHIKESFEIVIKNKEQEDIRPIRISKQFINENYMKPITLKEVSDYVGFNDSYFSYLFKKENGITFLDYLSEVRMNKAKELLKNTDLSVAEICERVGYNDLKYFVKSFKKFTGIKPSEYRKLFS
ncbi:two-component system, response regulator YesN [Caloramator quimbayensis]|uniref:Stage 0 sporulation protein A homolog n=1 Tax=Caloramator quimbayensis TaxID=1147123 RepID=A0A1T4Y8D8_9CLOT|nr:helix-turn-helix domain-containing protein [Caloramator quimbayensis]SKA98087.1 two-component system, response regulator YesN [Caloramator quimbayensis]